MLTPAIWNVIVLGGWNREALTPSRIAHRLFGLEPSTPIKVAVPLDTLGPLEVFNPDGTIAVKVDRGRIKVTPSTKDYMMLDEAKRVAAVAIRSLPETPLTAAGFNVDFYSADPSSEALAFLEGAIDTRLSEKSFEITSKSIKRTIAFDDGAINLTLASPAGALAVSINFERRDTSSENLIAWLEMPRDKFSPKVKDILEALELEWRGAEDG